MKFSERLRGAWRGFRASPPRRRNGAAFPAADLTRLTSSWTTDPGAINRWLRYELVRLRARSRQLARGDAYGAKFIKSAVDNIAGAKPFALQSKIKTQRSGRFNVAANTAIELAWSDRCRPGGCEVTGKLSFYALIRLVIRCLARDGEVLLRHIRGGEYGARGLYQLLDIDRLDEQLNENLNNGGAIKMGVELDQYSKPVAYHVLKQHPGEMGEWNRGYERKHERIPANEIRHLFIADWPEQVRGFPWMHAAMVRLWNLGGFEEAAVVNARIGASKVAVLQTAGIDDQASLASGMDAEGNFLTDIEPGQYWRLPQGTTLESFNPAFPDEAVGPFIGACLRGAAAAVGMSYHSLANDPSQVNYSTGQIFAGDERDMWMSIQQWVVEHFCQPDAEDWLRGAILDGVFPQNYWGYRTSLQFQCKRWRSIDPEKEISADAAALAARLTSRTRIAAKNGEDFEEILDELAAEQELAKEKGVELEPVKPAPKPAEPTPEPDAATSDAAKQKLRAI